MEGTGRGFNLAEGIILDISIILIICCNFFVHEPSLMVLQVWARQRSSIYVHDCLNGYLISILLSYLVSLDKINNSMKALQILRVVLDFIGMLRSFSEVLILFPYN